MSIPELPTQIQKHYRQERRTVTKLTPFVDEVETVQAIGCPSYPELTGPQQELLSVSVCESGWCIEMLDIATEQYYWFLAVC